MKIFQWILIEFTEDMCWDKIIKIVKLIYQKICVLEKNHNNQVKLWKSVLKQQDWKCFSDLRPRFYMSTQNWDNFKTETISKLRQFQNWENILTETISKLRQSQKLSKIPKPEWISKLTQSQSCANLNTEMPRPIFRNVFPRLVTCRTAIAKLIIRR